MMISEKKERYEIEVENDPFKLSKLQSIGLDVVGVGYALVLIPWLTYFAIKQTYEFCGLEVAEQGVYGIGAVLVESSTSAGNGGGAVENDETCDVNEVYHVLSHFLYASSQACFSYFGIFLAVIGVADTIGFSNLWEKKEKGMLYVNALTAVFSITLILCSIFPTTPWKIKSQLQGSEAEFFVLKITFQSFMVVVYSTITYWGLLLSQERGTFYLRYGNELKISVICTIFSLLIVLLFQQQATGITHRNRYFQTEAILLAITMLMFTAWIGGSLAYSFDINTKKLLARKRVSQCFILGLLVISFMMIFIGFRLESRNNETTKDRKAAVYSFNSSWNCFFSLGIFVNYLFLRGLIFPTLEFDNGGINKQLWEVLLLNSKPKKKPEVAGYYSKDDFLIV